MKLHNQLRTRPPCQACGIWTCSACGWQRGGANRDAAQDCTRCGGTDGGFQVIRHHAGRGYYEDHNPVAGPLCRSGYLCEHRSCRMIARGR